MSKFAIYKNENKISRKTYPYFVDVQSDLLDELNSRLIIPLTTPKTVNDTNAKKLCPIIEIDQGKFLLLTHQMTSVPKSILKTKVGTIESFRDEIIGAIDLLITGI